MLRRHIMIGSLASALAFALAAGASAQEVVKFGLIVPLTGAQASTGKQIEAAVRLYMQQNGSTLRARRSI
jgi:branched-chain amino acid transport system substrate-binding protein